MAVPVLCTVRECGRLLSDVPGGLSCERGHRFDRSRFGYVNLLQPQDRRSESPGDAAPMVRARRRIAERGHTAPLIEDLATVLSAAGIGNAAAVLDVGCGDGWVLAELTQLIGVRGVGVDLSRPALELAGKLGILEVYGVNADRGLPFGDGTFDAVLSVTARQQPAEFRRVLGAEGVLVLVLSGADDLREVRERLFGRAEDSDRRAAARERFAQDFTVGEDREVRVVRRLSGDAVRDLLAGSYRGARLAAQEAVARLTDLDVTLHWQILVLRPR